MARETDTRILVADDQPDILEALRLLLAQHDFSPKLVTTPTAVVEQLRSASWDLLLMDLNYLRDTTSGDEGLELLRAVRGIDATLPIVVMTAWGNIELAVEAMRAGAQSFVQKPWDNAALVQVLRRETERGRELRDQSERHHREEREGLLIQRALLPATLPDTAAFEIAGAWQPAAGFGGDTYDAFTFGPMSLGLSIADVAGKGVPAALSMSSLQAAVRAFALEAAAPHAICASVNRLLCGQMIAGRFATFCYVHLDRDRGTACYANAGHNPPLLARNDGSITRLTASGTVLGVFPDAEYSTSELRIESGDRLLLYTDGVTEARDEHDEEFGEDRLAAALLEARRLDAHALFQHVLDRVISFAGRRGLQDDATLLVVALR